MPKKSKGTLCPVKNNHGVFPATLKEVYIAVYQVNRKVRIRLVSEKVQAFLVVIYKLPYASLPHPVILKL